MKKMLVCNLFSKTIMPFYWQVFAFSPVYVLCTGMQKHLLYTMDAHSEQYEKLQFNDDAVAAALLHHVCRTGLSCLQGGWRWRRRSIPLQPIRPFFSVQSLWANLPMRGCHFSSFSFPQFNHRRFPTHEATISELPVDGAILNRLSLINISTNVLIFNCKLRPRALWVLKAKKNSSNTTRTHFCHFP